jgi:hypothetical protein
VRLPSPGEEHSAGRFSPGLERSKGEQVLEKCVSARNSDFGTPSCWVMTPISISIKKDGRTLWDSEWKECKSGVYIHTSCVYAIYNCYKRIANFKSQEVDLGISLMPTKQASLVSRLAKATLV